VRQPQEQVLWRQFPRVDGGLDRALDCLAGGVDNPACGDVQIADVSGAFSRLPFSIR
jgi:hypothetical protein